MEKLRVEERSKADAEVESGRVTTLVKIIVSGPSLNQRHFLVSVARGDSKSMRLLLNCGFDVSGKHEGWSALHVATLCESVETIAFLKETGADVNLKTDDGLTALYMAVERGSLDVVEALLKPARDDNSGCDVNAKNGKNDRTALQVAVIKGHTRIVRTLLSTEADRSVQGEFLNGDIFDILHLAANYGRIDVVDLLLSEGFNPAAISSFGKTSLFLAALEGHCDVVVRLLKAGVKVDVTNGQDEWTALHAASWSGCVDVINVLLKHGAFLFCKGRAWRNTGWSALHFAAYNGKIEALNYLLSSGMDADIRANNGDTPLWWAVWKHQSEIVVALSKAGADPNLKNNSGRSPLDVAVQKNKQDIIEILQKYQTRSDRRS